MITAQPVLDCPRDNDLLRSGLSAKTFTDQPMVQHAQTARRGWAFPVSGEVTMAWLPRPDRPLRDQINEASRELKLARRDGSAEWIEKAAAVLDALIDQIPRTAQPQGTGL